MHIDIQQDFNPRDLGRKVKEFIAPVINYYYPDMTVGDVLTILRSRPKPYHIQYFYVVNKEKKLIGVFSARDLLFHQPETKIEEILDHEVAKVKNNDSLEKALKIMSDHHILALPIVDNENHLEGYLKIAPPEENLVHSVNTQAQLLRDIYQFIGFSVEQRKWHSAWRAYSLRMPWLICNLVAGLICAGIANLLKEILIQFVIIAMFIPLVLTLCESVATQSLTLALQCLHQMRKKQLIMRLARELKTVTLLGITCGGCSGLAYLLWSLNPAPLIVIAISVFLSVIVSASFGLVFPIWLHRFSLDPKVASGPLILMFTDICATAIYLGLSTWWLLHTPLAKV